MKTPADLNAATAIDASFSCAPPPPAVVEAGGIFPPQHAAAPLRCDCRQPRLLVAFLEAAVRKIKVFLSGILQPISQRFTLSLHRTRRSDECRQRTRNIKLHPRNPRRVDVA